MYHYLPKPRPSRRNKPNCSSAQIVVWVYLTPQRGSHCPRTYTVRTFLQPSKMGRILSNGVKINTTTSGHSPVISRAKVTPCESVYQRWPQNYVKQFRCFRFFFCFGVYFCQNSLALLYTVARVVESQFNLVSFGGSRETEM